MADGPPLRLTERRNPRSIDIDTADPLTLVDLINAEDATIPTLVAGAREEIAQTVSLIEASFRAGGRLLYVGAGTSGRLGVLDASECPPTFGTPPEMVVGIIAGGLPALIRSAEGAEDDVDAGARIIDEHKVGPADTVVGIAASGGTPYVRGALTQARALGARTAMVACAELPEAVLAVCDVTIVVRTGPEVVTGSTRMKAGTATKLILNTLTTAAMIRLGKTYGNLMVDVRASNEKLRARSRRIVALATGAPEDVVERALTETGGEVKNAILTVLGKVDAATAARLLDASHGHLRAALSAAGHD